MNIEINRMDKVIFVDRDGTINIDTHYLSDPDQFYMYSGVGEGIRKLKDNHFKIIVITNQSGIARGYFSEDQLFNIHERMKKELQKFGVMLDGIYHCPHHPDENCHCRKPNIGLFERAIKEHNVDIQQSYVIGDKIIDIDAGKKIGIKTILVPEPHMRSEIISRRYEWNNGPDYIANNFSDAVEWILKSEY